MVFWDEDTESNKASARMSGIYASNCLCCCAGIPAWVESLLASSCLVLSAGTRKGLSDWTALFFNAVLRCVYAESERTAAGVSRAGVIFAEARRITSSSAGAKSSGGIPPTAT
jgi:hypothetical protein